MCGKCLEQSQVEDIIKLSNIITFACPYFQPEHLSQDVGKGVP